MANDPTQAAGDVMSTQAVLDPPTGGDALSGDALSNGVETDYSGHESVVRVRGVKRTYEIGGTPVHALRGVDIDIFRGEYISIMGPSGSGKSTLFNMIGGLDKPNRGSVFINEVDIAQLSPSELAYLRCHTIGYIFQTFNLINVRTALENVTLPMLFAGLASDEADERGMELLDLVGLGERYH